MSGMLLVPENRLIIQEKIREILGSKPFKLRRVSNGDSNQLENLTLTSLSYEVLDGVPCIIMHIGSMKLSFQIFDIKNLKAQDMQVFIRFGKSHMMVQYKTQGQVSVTRYFEIVTSM